MHRDLFVVAYDITDPSRLTRARHLLKGYSTGGQKSVFECFLSPAEARELQQKLMELIDEADDRVHLFPLDGRSKPHVLGVAEPPADPDFFYFG